MPAGRPVRIARRRATANSQAASLISLLPITGTPKVFKSWYSVSISCCFGFGIGERMNGLGISPRSQVAVL